jgi:mannose-6-phosphate isomerase-like protein (cupin superfamily)
MPPENRLNFDAPLFLQGKNEMTTMNKTKKIQAPGRRVVTGFNASGKSVVVSDGPVPKESTWVESGIALGVDLWVVNHVPIDLTDTNDPLVGYTLQSWPPPGGIICRMLTWEPGFTFPMHRSDTIDFLFIISGQIEVILEEGSALLRSGETLVQRGTNHGMRVVGNIPCTFAAVLIDASPQAAKIGSEATEATSN